MPSLLIGAGNSRVKKVSIVGEEAWTGELVTLDMNNACGADIVWDLENRPLPFKDEEFDEIGAYDVLEHIGRQGDWRGWFDEMAEYHRILKPGGKFGIMVPVGEDRFADPGHTRFFGFNHFMFLNQKFYADAIAMGTACTDYRWYWKKNFNVLGGQELEAHHITVVMQKD